MSESKNIETVRRYMEACNIGELDALMRTLAPDVVHFFLEPDRAPVRGAEHLAHLWRKFKQVLDPRWAVDRIIASGDEVVAEWSCAYTPSGTQKRRIFRGSEWYVMRDGLISEIRAYYDFDVKRNCELTGFPYDTRGYLASPAGATKA